MSIEKKIHTKISQYSVVKLKRKVSTHVSRIHDVEGWDTILQNNKTCMMYSIYVFVCHHKNPHMKRQQVTNIVAVAADTTFSSPSDWSHTCLEAQKRGKMWTWFRKHNILCITLYKCLHYYGAYSFRILKIIIAVTFDFGFGGVFRRRFSRLYSVWSYQILQIWPGLQICLFSCVKSA